MFKRIAVLLYGVVSYAVFFGTFLYAIGFIGNFFVPKSIDGEPEIPFGKALLINGALLGLFALQHSVMARPAFKRWWTKLVPAAVERSTYVLFSSLALILLFANWQPLGGMIWNVEDVVGRIVLYALFGLGWALVLYATFLINHFDLFGLRQVWLHVRGKEYTRLQFRTPSLYKLVRHPLYAGWLLTFWSSPTMTGTHLLFALATTAYILVAIRFEEHDLVGEHGATYTNYRRRVPMLVPSFKTKQFQEAIN